MNARAMIEAAIAAAVARLSDKQTAAADLAEDIRKEQATIADLDAALSALPEAPDQ
ncbi:hypothetical protein [Leifsonia sp. Root227]|uniref:hypothetical protein n=1 Tax=Leifsonia sp. Root227 TaxID=1736496 RepID=UPI000B0B69CF|nr:hypothetical protein [Leifsonia sp. Root227]